MLLPDAAKASDACRVLVAMAPYPQPADEPRVVGAIATAGSHRNVPIHWPRVSVHVIPPMRRRGIMTALLHAAVASERRRGLGIEPDGRAGTIALAAWSLVAPGSTAEQVWKSLGFTNHVTLAEHEVSLAEAEARLGPLHEQMTQAGWIPEDAQVLPLAQTTPTQQEQLIALHLAHLGGNAQQLREQLIARRGGGGFDRDLSMVLLRGGRAVGFTLGGMLPDGACSIDANVLEPAHRLGWANLLLKLTAARVLRARGVERVRFQSCDFHTDTRKTTRMLGGDLRHESRLMYRSFPPITSK